MAEQQKRPAFLQRAIEQAIGNEQSFGREDDPAAKKWPYLWNWLTTWEVGKNNIKTPPSITIRLGPDGVLCSVSDRDLGKAVDVALPHLADCFNAIEEALAGGKVAVRNIGRGETKVRKRKTGN